MPFAVHGLRELERAFRAADKELANDLRDALAESAAPVRADAQRLAAAAIRNVGHGDPWSRMRVGVARSVAYVAPVERGVTARGGQRGRRPNLGNLLMDRAMQPALAANESKVAARFEQLIDEVADVWERA